jgi:hypothetical protein
VKEEGRDVESRRRMESRREALGEEWKGEAWRERERGVTGGEKEREFNGERRVGERKRGREERGREGEREFNGERNGKGEAWREWKRGVRGRETVKGERRREGEGGDTNSGREGERERGREE